MKVIREFEDIWQKVQSQTPLSREDGYRLIQSHNLVELSHMADYVKTQRYGNKAFYTHSVNLNYTNICVLTCKFCAFAKKKGDEAAYVWEIEDIVKKVKSCAQRGIWEVHVVGGLHADLKLDYYEAMCSEIKKACPGVLIQGFTAVEIDFFARLEKISIKEVLTRLKAAGLGGIPGGGAEIFAERPRKLVCETKISAKRWLEVHEIAHSIGFNTNATMLYGHVETPAERVDHMMELRELQDKTSGFLAFVPLAYQPENNQLDCKGTSGVTDLQVLATSRLMLHNFPHIRQLWNYVDTHLIHVALRFGVDDLGGTNFDETIAKEAGSVNLGFTHDELNALILKCGGKPEPINSTYTPVDRERLVAI